MRAWNPDIPLRYVRRISSRWHVLPVAFARLRRRIFPKAAHRRMLKRQRARIAAGIPTENYTQIVGPPRFTRSK